MVLEGELEIMDQPSRLYLELDILAHATLPLAAFRLEVLDPCRQRQLLLRPRSDAGAGFRFHMKLRRGGGQMQVLSPRVQSYLAPPLSDTGAVYPQVPLPSIPNPPP